jgi:hypothetical protein
MNITSRNRSRPITLQGKSAVSLFLSLVFLFIVFPVSTVLVIGYHRHAFAAGSVYHVPPLPNNPPSSTDCQNWDQTIAAQLQVLKPGDTLSFDGTTYPSLRLDPANPFTKSNTALHGTATALITLEATSDGGTTFDPKICPNIFNEGEEPIFVSGSSYVLLQGFVARNSPGNVVYLWGGGVQPNDHITLRRITAHDAASGGNYHVFANEDGNTNILIEDCAGWGTGRYIFDNYHVSYTTLRRTFAYWENAPNFNAPRAGYSVYGSHDVLLENAISRHVVPPPGANDPQEYASLYRTDDQKGQYPTYNTTLDGVMFFDNWDGIYINSASGKNTQIANSYFESPNTFSTSTGTSTNGKGNGINWQSKYDGTITNSVFANNTIGFARNNSSAPITIQNSVFLKNQTAIYDGTKNSNQSGTNHNWNDFFGNTKDGVSHTGLTEYALNPGYDTTTYGQGAYLFVPPTSPLKGKGQNGADIGANILYEYVNGTPTNQPLWPWPMESRICAERGISVTWASNANPSDNCNGGLWNTLTGVYPA